MQEKSKNEAILPFKLIPFLKNEIIVVAIKMIKPILLKEVFNGKKKVATKMLSNVTIDKTLSLFIVNFLGSSRNKLIFLLYRLMQFGYSALHLLTILFQ